MTMSRYDALHRYWEDYPPADLLVAAYFKAGVFKDKNPRSRRPQRPGMQPNGKFDERGFPIRQDGTKLPPTLSEKPGTLTDMAKVLKRSGKKSFTF
jgi:hypothetical protein